MKKIKKLFIIVLCFSLMFKTTTIPSMSGIAPNGHHNQGITTT